MTTPTVHQHAPLVTTRGPGVTVVVNGQASGAPSAVLEAAIVRTLREHVPDVELERTQSLTELAALWRRDDGRRLVLVGGDGSIHAVANFDGPPRDVALIPAGSANNIARSTGIPRDPLAAARLAATGTVRPLDLIEVATESRRLRAVEAVSAGFLAQARTRYHGRNSGDVVAGLRAGAGALARFQPFDTAVGEEYLRLVQVFVANLPLYEFGLRVAPHADPADEALDVIGIEGRSRAAVLRMLLELRRGTHLRPHRRHPAARVWRARQVTLITNGSPIVADSTDLGPGPVILTPAPGALRLVRP